MPLLVHHPIKPPEEICRLRVLEEKASTRGGVRPNRVPINQVCGGLDHVIDSRFRRKRHLEAAIYERPGRLDLRRAAVRQAGAQDRDDANLHRHRAARDHRQAREWLADGHDAAVVQGCRTGTDCGGVQLRRARGDDPSLPR